MPHDPKSHAEGTIPQPAPKPGGWEPGPGDTPYDRVGGRAAVLALAERFYDLMEQTEPELTAVHTRDPAGKVSRPSRDHFALFLVHWLGGPQDYLEQRGHPRLRMRHGHFPLGTGLRDAWLRCMSKALNDVPLDPAVRTWLDGRFANVADHLRNRPD